MRDSVPVYVPLAAVIVGALLALTGALRPAFLWHLGRVRLGRRWIGDGGVTALFIVIGCALIALGVALLRSRRGGPRSGDLRRGP